MSRELLQQALDALEPIAYEGTDAESHRVRELRAALRAALAAPQPEPVALCDALRWSGAKESHGAMMFSPEQLRKFYEFASAPPAAPAPAVPAISPLALRALRMADMALASWENGYAFDSHGPGREAQRLVTDALALSAAPAAPDGAVPPGSWEHLKVMMQHSAWEGTLQLSDALANIDDFAKSAAPAVREPQPLVEIRRRATPCGECHLQPGERCDICGAHAIEQAHGIGGGGNG